MARYCFSDLHGNYNLWKQIQNYLKNDDKAFCLGDCCDRGPDGVKIMQEVLLDKRITYLKGNHEIDLIDTFTSETPLSAAEIERLKYNGVEPTIDAFNKLSPQEQLNLITELDKLPICITIANEQGKILFLSHAGCNLQYYKQLSSQTNIAPLLWDRKHIHSTHWGKQPGDENIYIIHGHTPVQLVGQNKYRTSNVLFYCDKHKIDLDLGTPTTNKAAILNLDTFEVTYFYDIDLS